MPAPTREEVDQVLKALRGGDPRAADDLLPHFYDELHKMAAACLRRERANHTLQPTALVHEAYLRLVGEKAMRWEDRAHFLAWAARVMRQVLVSHARKRKAEKRGGGRGKIPLDEVTILYEQRTLGLQDLNEALEKLASLDERKARIVEMRFFGDLTVPEVAEVLGLSQTTIEREWRFARAWLHRAISGGETDGG